jgi:aminopeptidase-like protein
LKQVDLSIAPIWQKKAQSPYLDCLLLLFSKPYLNTNPKCEPQLGKRGLYGGFGGKKNTKNSEMAMLWILNLSDGIHSLLDVSDRANISFSIIKEVADALAEGGLLIDCCVG